MANIIYTTARKMQLTNIWLSLHAGITEQCIENIALAE